MANVNAPRGFQEWAALDGAPFNFGMSIGYMLAAQSTAVFQGDPVVLGTSGNAGYLLQGSVTGNTGAAIAGIFMSCTYLSISQKKRVWSNYWPGSDCVANTLVSCHIGSHPSNLYVVQAQVGPITQASVGLYGNFATGSGNTANGLSGFTLDATTLNATAGVLPFQVVKVLGSTGSGNNPIGPGQDPTTAYNLVIVRAVNLLAGL